jgi:hypothetical protein
LERCLELAEGRAVPEGEVKTIRPKFAVAGYGKVPLAPNIMTLSVQVLPRRLAFLPLELPLPRLDPVEGEVTGLES